MYIDTSNNQKKKIRTYSAGFEGNFIRMDERAVMGIDLGTTSSRAAVF